MLGITAVRNARHAAGFDKLRGAFSLYDAFDGLAATSRTLRTATTASETTGNTTGNTTENTTGNTTVKRTTGSPLFTLLHGERVAGPISIERKPVFAVVELAGTYVLGRNAKNYPRTNLLLTHLCVSPPTSPQAIQGHTR